MRAGAMVAMFAVFFGLFLKDWKFGWPKKNEVYYTFLAFQAAKEAFEKHEEAGGTAEGWESFARGQKIGFPKEEGLLPTGVDPDGAWPGMLADYEAYKRAYQAEGKKPTPPGWTGYTARRGWSSVTPEKSYPKKKIDEQLHYGLGSGVLLLLGLFFMVRTSRRSMKVDGEAFHAPNGVRIPFSDMVLIDKRKWESKGLAYVRYKAGGAVKKAKVDGMVYGQFKAEDGAPAERLFQRILQNFSGDLMELGDAGEEEGEAPEDSAAAGGSAGAEVAGEEDGKAPGHEGKGD